MHPFYAMLSRMKYINRWGLMRNTQTENLCEHSWDTAVIAHALAVLRNTRFGGHANPERAATLALFHDVTEVITGDSPTPVKYYNAEIRRAYREVEDMAQRRLLSMLPGDLQPVYRPLVAQDDPRDAELLPLVKAADKLSAIIKCMEERSLGNQEFTQAEQTLRESLAALHIPEADWFAAQILPSYALTLDEQDNP